MTHILCKITLTLAILINFAFAMSASALPIATATYCFNDSLAADESGVPSLVSVDPLGANTFESAIVFGQNRRVFHFDGNSSPSSEQAGLSLDTTGLIPADNYSVEMVFEFIEDTVSWRRILDVENRESDNGFYVEPDSVLQVYPESTGTTIFTTNEFHHVVLTNSFTGEVKAYLDGTLEITIPSTTVMNINNPGNLMNFFLDNTIGAGQGEFADGRIALLRLYDSVLTNSDVSILADNPFESCPVPEPATYLLLGSGLGGLVLYRRIQGVK